MSVKRLDYDFFHRPTAQVARDLIGKLFIYHRDIGDIGGRIVETEAYLGKDDPACHSAKGMTRSNAQMFGTCGRSYLYHNYGIHICYNVTTDNDDIPAAVLLRAIEPLYGIQEMIERRQKANGEVARLCNGPGNLTRAMDLQISLNGQSVLDGGVIGFYDDGFRPQDIAASGRIGISAGKDLQLRFVLAGSPFLSRKIFINK